MESDNTFTVGTVESAAYAVTAGCLRTLGVWVWVEGAHWEWLEVCSGLANETWPPLAPSGLDQETGHLVPSLEAHALQAKQDHAFPQALWRGLGSFSNPSSEYCLSSEAPPLTPPDPAEDNPLETHGKGVKGHFGSALQTGLSGSLARSFCTCHPLPSIHFFSCGTHVPQHTRGGQGTTVGAGSLPGCLVVPSEPSSWPSISRAYCLPDVVAMAS